MSEVDVENANDVDYVAVLSAVSQEALVVLEPFTDHLGRVDFVARWANEASAEFLRTPVDRILGATYRGFFPDVGALFALICAVSSDGITRRGRLDLDGPATPIRRIEYRIAPAGRHLAVSVVDRSDERAAAELAGRLEVMHRTGASMSVAAAAILRPILGPDGRVVDLVFDYVNERSARYLGRPAETIVGRRVSDLFPPDASDFVAATDECWHRQEAVAFDLDISDSPVPADWLRFHLVPLADSIVAHAIDISGVRVEELALRSSEARYRSLFETANEAIMLIGPTGRFLLANAATAEAFDVDHAELLGLHLQDFVDPCERDRVRAEGELAIATGVATPRRRVRYRRAGGTPWWGLTASSLVHDAAGNFVGYEVMVLDVDAETELELALRESESRYRAVVDNTDVLILMTDRTGRLVFANREAERVLATPAAHLVGRRATELLPLEDRPTAAAELAALIRGDVAVQRRRLNLVRGDGRLVPCFATAVPLRTDERFEGLVLVAADISEVVEREHARRELAAALAVAEQSERTQLASDLHDGPVQRLTALSMLLGAEQRRTDRNDALITAAEETVRATITELRTLMFHLTPPDLGGHEIGFVLGDRARKLLGAACVVEVDDRWTEPPDLTTAHVLFRIAHEALVNVAKHAQATEVRISLTETPTDYLLEVVDNGVGGDPADFFSRSPGHLGVRSMVDRTRQMGGRCEIESVPGAGTTVFVRLPRDLTNV